MVFSDVCRHSGALSIVRFYKRALSRPRSSIPTLICVPGCCVEGITPNLSRLTPKVGPHYPQGCVPSHSRSLALIKRDSSGSTQKSIQRHSAGQHCKTVCDLIFPFSTWLTPTRTNFLVPTTPNTPHGNSVQGETLPQTAMK